MNYLRTLLMLLLSLCPFALAAQSQLALCQGSSPARWNNCVGAWTNPGNEKYQGEWKFGKPHGQGTYRS